MQRPWTAESDNLNETEAFKLPSFQGSKSTVPTSNQPHVIVFSHK